MRLEDLADGLDQLGFLRDLAFPSAAGWCERTNLRLGLSQPVVQAFALTLAMGRRVLHQHSFWPLTWLLSVLDPTGALEFIPLSHQHLLTLIIRSEYALELAGPGLGDPLADPLGHL